MNSILQTQLHDALVCRLRHTPLKILFKKYESITSQVVAPLH